MDFYQDIVDELTIYFQIIDPKIKIDKLITTTPPITNIDQKRLVRHQANCLLERFLNMKKRKVSKVRHSVFYSSEVSAKIKSKVIDESMISVIGIIENELKSGQNTNGRLSKLWAVLSTNDGMLNDWGIYHFHLSNEKKYADDQFYKRTGPLLIAYIPQNKKEAYFLDIAEEHSTDKTVFANQEYLSVIDNNWPELFEGLQIKGIRSELNVTDDVRLRLRDGGVNHIDSVNGKLIFNPGGGITSAGTSMSCQISTDKIMENIKNIETQCREEQKRFVPKQIPEYIDFSIKLVNENFVIIKHPLKEKIHVIPLTSFL